VGFSRSFLSLLSIRLAAGRLPSVHTRNLVMQQFAILCYHAESVVCAWSKEEDDAVMAKLLVVQDKLVKAGKLGPVARLMPTTTATTLRKDRTAALVVDGPFA
jgi:hypothetical protein